MCTPLAKFLNPPLRPIYLPNQNGIDMKSNIAKLLLVLRDALGWRSEIPYRSRVLLSESSGVCGILIQINLLSGNEQCSAPTAADRRGEQNTAESKHQQARAPSTESDGGELSWSLVVRDLTQQDGRTTRLFIPGLARHFFVLLPS